LVAEGKLKLQKPASCDEEIWKYVDKCFEKEPDDRCSANNLFDQLSVIYKSKTNIVQVLLPSQQQISQQQIVQQHPKNVSKKPYIVKDFDSFPRVQNINNFNLPPQKQNTRVTLIHRNKNIGSFLVDSSLPLTFYKNDIQNLVSKKWKSNRKYRSNQIKIWCIRFWI